MKCRHRQSVLLVSILSVLACFLQCVVFLSAMHGSSYKPSSNQLGDAPKQVLEEVENPAKKSNVAATTPGDQKIEIDPSSLVPRWSSLNETKPGIHIFGANITVIRLVGERHSGTTFFEKHLQECFPQQTIVAHFVRKKHWFQPHPQEVEDAAQKYGEKGLGPTALENALAYKSWWEIANSPNPKRAFHDSLVLLLVRDPYDWMEAMRLKPHHWPNHVDLIPVNSSALKKTEYTPEGGSANHGRRLMQATMRHATRSSPQPSRKKKSATIYDTPSGTSFADSMRPGTIHRSFFTKRTLNWQEFVGRPMQIQDYAEMKGTTFICQKGFSFGAVSPCVRNISYIPAGVAQIPRSFLRKLPFDINDVVYELQPGNNNHSKPYENAMGLRAAKLKNFLEMPLLWELGGFGLIRYEDTIGGGLEVVVNEIAKALQLKSQCPKAPPFQPDKRRIPKEFREWITQNADWSVERIAGYSPE